MFLHWCKRMVPQWNMMPPKSRLINRPNRPSYGKRLALPIVAVGVGALLGGHVGLVGGLCIAMQNRQSELGNILLSKS